MTLQHDRPRTLGELRASGWRPRSVKDEMRANLIARIRRGEPLFPGIVGYEKTVDPADRERDPVAARLHPARPARPGQDAHPALAPSFLDEWIPAVEGCEIHDDPLAPDLRRVPAHAAELGRRDADRWIHRDERYQEKLATPDVTIADLIGDIDPIKAAHAASSSTPTSEVIHYGIIPRTNRGIFAINELPDLQPRIQVGLLNILEEKDVQIRGFPVRLPLDMLIVFSANPEDYTNRGNIITPLRDRIASQIMTHYPLHARGRRWRSPRRRRGPSATAGSRSWSRASCASWSRRSRSRRASPSTWTRTRASSARMTIALHREPRLERRAPRRCGPARRGRGRAHLRPAERDRRDHGKVELVYEGEQEGAANVARAPGRQGREGGLRQRLPRRVSSPRGAARTRRRAAGLRRRSSEWFAAGKQRRDLGRARRERVRTSGSPGDGARGAGDASTCRSRASGGARRGDGVRARRRCTRTRSSREGAHRRRRHRLHATCSRRCSGFKPEDED